MFDTLSTTEYLEALDLTEEALREMGSTEEGNFSLGEDKKWHGQQGSWTMTSFSAYEIQEDERDEYFAENLSPGRYAEISSGNELTHRRKKAICRLFATGLCRER